MKKWLAILMAVAYAGISHGQDIIDSWSFTVDPDPNASIATSLSTSDIAGGGGATWADNNNSSIEGGEAKFIRAGTQNYFKDAIPSVVGIAGATTGKFQCEWDFTSVDFANTALLDQKTTWALGIRGAGNSDAMVRLQYEGQLNVTNVNVAGVTNIYADANHIALLVKDANFNWTEAATFSGSSIANLHLRLVYDLDNSTFTTYYAPDGGSETLLHDGTLPSGWAISTYRIAAQFLNGGSIWEVGDELFVDNITFTQLESAAPPPALALIDLWTYTDNTNGAGMGEGVSTGYVGGVSFGNADVAVITNNMLLFQHTSTNESQDSIFRTATPSLYASGTTGIYELAWDYVASDFSISDASNTTGNAGMTIRDTANGNVAMGFRLRFDGNNHLLQMDDANGNNQTMATFPGSTLSNLSVRLVMDLDNSGSAGSAALLYTLDGGVEIGATYEGTVHANFELSQYRMIVQTVNGGNGWQLGDTILTDNLRFEKVAAMPLPPVYGNLVVYEMNDPVDTLLNALAQTGTDGGQFVGADANIAANGLGSLVASGDGTNDVYRAHDLDFAYVDGLHRLEFAFDEWNLVASEDSSSLKFGFGDSTGNNNVQFGIDVNTNNGTVRFRAAANNGGGAGQDFYDHAGYVASTGVVLRIDANLDAGTYSASWWYDNQTEDDAVSVVSGASLGALSDIAQVKLTLNVGGTIGMDPADYINVDYLRYTSTAVIPTAAEFYNAWLAEYPTLGALTNLTDNKDGDALDNLGEYAFGGDPDDPNDIGYVPNMGDTVDIGGTNYILHVYQRRQDNSIRGLSHWIELDTDLIFDPAFTNDTSLYTIYGAANVDDTWRSITNAVNAGAGVRFINTKAQFTP
ncbi:hypothetical protein [Pontiella desulfatans]|nr:hypothetical protein [Pontiella desulfatans]